eukprot:scpid104252/ scgid7410/ 
MSYELDTDSFPNAFTWMVGRRGLPLEMLSDNGTYFVGANKELLGIVHQLDQEAIQRSLATRGVVWHFNPLLAPHQGGVHEVMIKAAKKALTAILDNSPGVVTDEQLTTAIVGVEALLNSRPLTYQSASADENTPLTPLHFLTV